MDPASAFSLAGTILQFIDTGGKFVGLALKFHRSTDEALSTFTELGGLTNNFELILAELEVPSCDSALPGQNQDGLVQLAGDCRKVIDELKELLKRFNIDNISKKGKKSKRDAIKLAFDSMWSDPEIVSLRSRLDGFRAQMNLHLLVSLRYGSTEHCYFATANIYC